MARLFGTDGVRGLANGRLTPELAMRLGVAVASELPRIGRGRPRAVLGRDTRASGEFLESAVSAGLASAGVDVLRLGIIPTPGVAYLTTSLGADLGVMISASHNPMPDNGIKFFDSRGFKLPDAVEDRIEANLYNEWDRPTGADVGRIEESRKSVSKYIEHLIASCQVPLDSLHVVVDCAHGAASRLAPEVYREAGARVTAICADPDGLNINDNCGATHMERVAASVVELGADIGIAHDGDADRCLAVDQHGHVVDGDQILAIAAVAAKERGALTGSTVVTTIMANLGFKRAMENHGIATVETAVGDRYVLETMLAGRYALGGEQSGHVIFADYATTGDGIVTGLQILGRMAATGASLASLAKVMTRYPQVLKNVRVADQAAALRDAEVLRAIDQAEKVLGDDGRIVVRASGTEPLVRVMVEAGELGTAEQVAAAVVDAVEHV